MLQADTAARLTAPQHDEAATAMAGLARLFPAVGSAPGVTPWEPRLLVRWLSSPRPRPQQLAACFLLAVWFGGTDWPEFGTELGLGDLGWLPTFHMAEAVAMWSDAELAGFRAWMDAPFWG